MTRAKAKLTYYLIALIVGTPAWIWLFVQDWKIALAVLLVMYANNLTNTADKL